MQCFIYKSLKKTELYLYVTDKDDFSKVPKPLFDSMGSLEFVMELELTAQRKLARENPRKVMDSLQTKGYFIQIPPVLVHPPTQQAQ